MAVTSSVAPVPVMAVVSAMGELEQSTDPFRERFGGCLEAIAEDPRLRRVLSCQLDRTTLVAEGSELDVEAVHDLAGKRMALLAAPAPDADSFSALAPNALLDERFDSSPAIVWLKDMDGRYLRANRRYTEVLSTSEDDLIGRTDEEFAPREVVDGPRLRRGIGPAHEPLQFEYTVEPFEGRPGLAVLRFAVLDRLGDPVAVCGVAAPLRRAHVARAECARIVRMERWSRLDGEQVKGEILDEWGVVRGAPPPESVPTHEVEDDASDSVRAEYQAVQAQRDAAIDEALARASEVARLQAELDAAQTHADELETSLAEALAQTTQPTAAPAEGDKSLRGELEQLRVALDQVRARAEAAERESAARQAELTQLHDELSAARASLAQAPASSGPPEPDPGPPAGPSAPPPQPPRPAAATAAASPPGGRPSSPAASSPGRRGGLLKMFGSRRRGR